jgi:hypothetical protein
MIPLLKDHAFKGKTNNKFVAPRKSPILHKWNEDISHVEGSTFTFPHCETQKVLEGLSRVNHLGQWTVPSLQDHAFEAELFRLKETLLWWHNLPGEKFLDPLSIMMRNLCAGPAFAEWLDNAVKYSFRISEGLAFNCNFEDYPEEAIVCWGFDYFFSPYHLLPYSTPPGEDWKLVLNDAPIIDHDDLQKLKTVIEDRIKLVPMLPQLDDLDRMKLQTSTKMLDDSNKRVYNFAHRGPRGTPLDVTNNFRYERLFVYKAPHESRDCFVPDEKTRNSLLLIKKQAALIFMGRGDDIQVRDFSDLPEWLTGYRSSYYIMSDQKKCGLTFPLTLVKALLEVLTKIYPNENLSHWEGYLNAQLTLDGKEWFKIRNGTGLGMANEVTSFLVSCVHELWYSERYPMEDLRSRFYNDDQVIRYEHKDPYNSPVDQLDYMVTDWNVWMAKFGMTTHARKPYVSRRGCYLETYGEDITDFCSKKVTQYVGCLFHALTCTNIVQAKEYVSSIMDCIGDKYYPEAAQALEIVIPLIGFEFYQGEVELPFEIGGWFRLYEDGLNRALYTAGELEGFRSACIPLLNLHLKTKEPDPRSTKVVNRKKFDAILDLGWDQDPSLFSWTEQARTAFGPPKVSSSHFATARDYSRLYKERQKAWKSGPCKTPFIEIMNFIEKDPPRFYKYKIPGELLVEDKNYSFLPECTKHPDSRKIWHVDKKRMWYILLNRLGLSEVKVFDFWPDVRNEALLGAIFTVDPEVREFFDQGPVPFEILFLNILWEMPFDLIKLKLKQSGFWKFPFKGRCVNGSIIDILHQVIQGKGNSLTWNMMTGEPVFILKSSLDNMLHNGQVFSEEANFKAIAESLEPSIDLEGIEEAYAIFKDKIDKAHGKRDYGPGIQESLPPHIQEELDEFRKYAMYMFEGVTRRSGQYLKDEDERLKAQLGLIPSASEPPDIFDDSDNEGGLLDFF